MKQKDFLVIGVVIFASVIVSYFAANVILPGSNKHDQQVEVVQVITSEFPEPDKRYFNAQSIDPTKIITIGKDSNANPFNGTGK